MRVIIQRAKKSNVKVKGKVVGEINSGFVLLVSFTEGDNIETIKKMIHKILSLRIFDDSEGIMNLAIDKERQAILSISQFTLYARTDKGNRPSYVDALNGEKAQVLYDLFNELLRKEIHVETGIFGAEMEVNIINDGPITICLEY